MANVAMPQNNKRQTFSARTHNWKWWYAYSIQKKLGQIVGVHFNSQDWDIGA